MHFNYSRHLLTGEEKQKLAIWNYQLGIEAKRIGLFDNALKFLQLVKNYWRLIIGRLGENSRLNYMRI